MSKICESRGRKQIVVCLGLGPWGGWLLDMELPFGVRKCAKKCAKVDCGHGFTTL